MNITINSNEYKILDTFDSVITIPDCFVVTSNKLGTGHGEAKLYIGAKNIVNDFFGNGEINCFLVKTDLISYLNIAKEEYMHPSQKYLGKRNLKKLWEERFDKVNNLEDIISFKIYRQTQIQGSRGYINSSDNSYNLIREISLPLISYLLIMKLQDSNNKIKFYLKLFVDFEAIANLKNGPLVFKYGNKKNIDNTDRNSQIDKVYQARIGQGKYRDSLLAECPYCPITMVNDERLLIASHIKPWAISNNKEKIDPKNGFILSPLYDKLFDIGFITFTDDKHMLVSDWLSPKNRERLKLQNNKYYQMLPMDEKRKEYLQYHREFVYKG